MASAGANVACFERVGPTGGRVRCAAIVSSCPARATAAKIPSHANNLLCNPVLIHIDGFLAKAMVSAARDEDGEDNCLLRPDSVKALRCGGRAFPVWDKRTHQNDKRGQYYDGEREHSDRITWIVTQRNHHETSEIVLGDYEHDGQSENYDSIALEPYGHIPRLQL